MLDTRRAVGAGVLIVLLLASAAATGYDTVARIIADGTGTGGEQGGGVVYVSAGDLPENRSYTVTARDADVCIGNCPNTTSGETQ